MAATGAGAPRRPWSEYNVLMITMDSCRFDSAGMARTPNLSRLGPLRKAMAPATFTLPAHMSFFHGYLPTVVEWPLEDYYSREAFHLWRVSRAKARPTSTIGLLLQGDTITEGFRNLGYRVVGAGGVRWFLTKTLTSLFDEFHFWGPGDYSNWFATRGHDDFALNHVDTLVESIARFDRYFLFVNALETHAPYNNGVDEVDEEVQRVIARAAPIWAGRRRRTLDVHLSPAEFAAMHRAQIRAVEAIDMRVGRLLSCLPRPIIVVVCGDHGECFGEDGQWGHGFVAAPIFEVPMYVGFVEE